MVDRQKVITGLDCCCSMSGRACRLHCPYGEECTEMPGSGTAHLCADALELLKKQPEIVWCKDCENWIPGGSDFDSRCKRVIGIWAGDDFCSHAERKVNQDG